MVDQLEVNIRLIDAKKAKLDDQLARRINELLARNKDDTRSLLHGWENCPNLYIIMLGDIPIGANQWGGPLDAAVPHVGWIEPKKRGNKYGRRAVELLAEEMWRAGVEAIVKGILIDAEPGTEEASRKLIDRIRKEFARLINERGFRYKRL